MGRKTNIIVTALIIILLFIILIIVKKNDIPIKEIAKSDILTTLENESNSVFYFGKINKKVEEQLKNYYTDYKIGVYTSNINPEEFNELFSNYEIKIYKNEYVLFSEKIPLTIVGDSSTDQKLFYKYLYKVIPEDEIAYKVLNTADEYIKKVNSNKFTIAVFGRESCSYCRLYLNTMNEEAKNKKLDIYYFDADNYNSKEYLDIIDKMNFLIPSKCSTKNKDSYMSDGFDKPLTIITKKGKMVDCLLGYVGEETLNNKLIEVGVIDE